MTDRSCVPLVMQVFLVGWLLLGEMGAEPSTLKYTFGVPTDITDMDMYVSATETTMITIIGPGHAVPHQHTIQQGSTHISLQKYCYLYTNEPHDTVLTVSSNKEINIHVLVTSGSSTWQSEGFLVLPITEMSTEYVVTAYNIFRLQATSYNNDSSSLAVSSHSDNTKVHVEFYTTGQSILFEGQYHNNGIINTALNEHSTATIRCDNDLTMARINSTKPVSVDLYGWCASVNRYSCALLAEQFLPIAFWKNTLMFGMLNTRIQYTIRILSSTNNNRVQVANESVVLNEGQLYEKHINSDVAIVVEADMPVLVLQYSEGYDVPTGGAAMLTVPAIEHFLSRYTFTVPPGYSTNHVTISIERRFVSGLRHNGQPLRGIIERHARISGDNNKVYSVVRFPVVVGVHRLTHDQHGVTFGAILYGFRNDGGYGFPLGLALGPFCTPRCENDGVCVSDNVCRCLPGFYGQHCEQGSAIDQHLKPELHTTIPGYSLTNPLAWYEQPDFTDNNKVCYVKVNVQNGHADLVVSATSSTGDGLVYGNFTTAPIDSTASFQGPSRFACLEVRCPFATTNGTFMNTVVRIAVQSSNQSCSVSHHTHSIRNITVTSGQANTDELEFTLETGKNYGPYYGVYYSMGTLGKAKYLAEHKCYSGHEYDFDSFNSDIGVLASYTC